MFFVASIMLIKLAINGVRVHAEQAIANASSGEQLLKAAIDSAKRKVAKRPLLPIFVLLTRFFFFVAFALDEFSVTQVVGVLQPRNQTYAAAAATTAIVRVAQKREKTFFFASSRGVRAASSMVVSFGGAPNRHNHRTSRVEAKWSACNQSPTAAVAAGARCVPTFSSPPPLTLGFLRAPRDRRRRCRRRLNALHTLGTGTMTLATAYLLEKKRKNFVGRPPDCRR